MQMEYKSCVAKECGPNRSRNMNVMRSLLIRHMVLVLFAGSVATLPIPVATNAIAVLILPLATFAPADEGRSCSCEMCRKGGGGQHCGCCTGESCRCSVSPLQGEETADSVLIVKAAVTPEPGGAVTITLHCSGFDPNPPTIPSTPGLQIPTPPPRAC
jgi:hypothetical protein